MFQRISLFSKIIFLIGILILVMGAIVFFSWSTLNVLNERDQLREAHLHLKNSVEHRVDFSRKRDSTLVDAFRTDIDLFGKLIPHSKNNQEANTLNILKEEYVNEVERYINLMRTRGLNENSGIEGDFRKKIHELEDLIQKYDELYIFLLQARRSEKDFIMRQQNQYVEKVDAAIHELMLKSESLNFKSNEKQELVAKATGYLVSFHAMVDIFGELKKLEDKIVVVEGKMQEAIELMLVNQERKAELLESSVIAWAFLFIIAGMVFSIIFAKHITKPIKRLEHAANAVSKGDLNVQVKVKTNDELGSYAVAFNKMIFNLRESAKIIQDNQEKLNKQNRELEKNYHEIEDQKLQMEKMYDNLILLSKMGQRITSNLHVTSIVRTIYDNIYNLMDISVYAIGIHDERNNRLNFYGANYKGEEITFSYDSLEENNLLSVWCYKNQQEVHINDYEKEFMKFISHPEESQNFQTRSSVIFVPISTEHKRFGVITVRSDKKNAFTDYHVYMLRNVAIYAAIAFDNAKAYEQISSHKEEILAQNGHLSHLNKELENQKTLIEEERKKSDLLLLNILPDETAKELKETGKATPKHYDSVTVMFADFKEFTKIAERASPIELVEDLDRYFAGFDEIIERHGIEKIKTIGDAYLCAGGLANEGPVHAINIINAALEIQQFMQSECERRKAEGKEVCWELRIGIHTGEIVAGVVGKNKFAYDIWGDTVNCANRLQGKCEPGKINISGATARLVEKHFELIHRGQIDVKHKGAFEMYYVEASHGKTISETETIVLKQK